MAKKLGRPTIYTEELADEIAEAVAASDRGFEWLLDNTPEFPSSATGWRWQAENPGFREKITRAKERQAERMAYRGLEILENADDYADAANSAGVAHARNKAEFLLKMIAKTAPRTMGDQRKLQLGGDPDAPPIGTVQAAMTIDPKDLTDEEFKAARALAHSALQRGLGKA